MNTWIALFRGINVGGNNKLPMKELAALLEKTHCQNVRTYIQSGNVIFQSPETNISNMANTMSTLVQEYFGFQPKVLILSVDELQKAAAENPFPQAREHPKNLHFYFLVETPISPALDKLTAMKQPQEFFELKENVFYLYTPEGLLSSKIADRLEKLLGTSGTARNLNTVTKLLEML